MALYKATDASPSLGVRLDGQAWSPGAGFGTIKGWTYPKPWTSSQFQRMNEAIRSMNFAWDELTDEQRAAWDAAAIDGRSWVSCVDDEEYST